MSGRIRSQRSVLCRAHRLFLWGSHVDRKGGFQVLLLLHLCTVVSFVQGASLLEKESRAESTVDSTKS
jgi:hypothetical protein